MKQAIIWKMDYDKTCLTT